MRATQEGGASVSADLPLAQAFASIVASIQLVDYDDLDPDVTAMILEPIGAIFREMTDADKAALTNLFVQCAQSESNPVRREIMSQMPEAFGLL
jgi:hypothetical protein